MQSPNQGMPRMHQMSNFEYSSIVSELGEKLAGKHFNRFRRIRQNTYRLKVGTTEIICELGVRIHETKYIDDAESPDKFVEKVNKELDNARLLSLEQINNDRIILFKFDRDRSLIFEMFGDGNAVLIVNASIISAVRYESWSGREIKVGARYFPPNSAPTPIPTDPTGPGLSGLGFSDKYIIVSLTKLPLGKDYVAEALVRSGIDEKRPGNSLSQAERERLEQELVGLRTSAKAMCFYDLKNSESPIDFSLAKLSRYHSLACKEFPSLSEAADEYYRNAQASAPNPQVEKLQRRLEKQKEQLVRLQGEEKENKEKGDFIYANYQAIDGVLALAKAGRFDELENAGAHPQVKLNKTNKKDKEIEIEL